MRIRFCLISYAAFYKRYILNHCFNENKFYCMVSIFFFMIIIIFKILKHGAKLTREMVGPWAVQIADVERRAAFIPLTEDMFFPSTQTLKDIPKLYLTHLESLGWKVIPVTEHRWVKECTSYDEKAKFIRDILLENHLLKVTKVPETISSNYSNS